MPRNCFPPDIFPGNVPGVVVPGAEECWITIDDVPMRYLRGGSGPALVLLHGLMGYSFSWRFTIPALSQDMTVIAPDMPGAGFSGRSDQLDVSFRASAERLLRFLDAIGVREFDLVGTSHGGAVAIMAAARLQQGSTSRLQRLVLVAPVNPWSRHGQRLSRVLTAGLMPSLVLLLAPRLTLAHRLSLRRLYGDPDRIPVGTLEGYSAPCETSASFEYPLRILRTWNPDLRELAGALPQIANVLTLVMWGTKDAAVDPASATDLCRNFRDCKLVKFEGAGHLPYEEVPEEFNRALRNFLLRP